MVRQYSRNEPITKNWMSNTVDWPLPAPKIIMDLVHLEAVFDVLELYLWLSYRFPDMFPDVKLVRDMETELDAIIQQGIFQITRLLRNSEQVLREDSEDAAQSRHRKGAKHQARDEPKGKLSEMLVSKGLITPQMLKKLQQELATEKTPESVRAKPNRNRRK